MGKGDTGVAPSTTREHVVRLSAVFNGAVDDEVLLRNVVKLPSRLPAGVEVLKSDTPEMDTIRTVVSTLDSGGEVYASRERVPGHRGKFSPVTRVQEPQSIIADMVRAAIGTGMRLSELCGLWMEDIDFLRKEVRVEAQLAPGRKERVPTRTLSSVRTIPIADDLIAVLKRRVAESTQGWIFETARGTPNRAASAGGELRKSVTHLRAGVTFHSFRHLCASRLISAGVSVKQVQRILGHATASTSLDVYAHFFPGDDDLSRAAIAGMVDSCGQIAGNDAQENDDIES